MGGREKGGRERERGEKRKAKALAASPSAHSLPAPPFSPKSIPEGRAHQEPSEGRAYLWEGTEGKG